MGWERDLHRMTVAGLIVIGCSVPLLALTIIMKPGSTGLALAGGGILAGGLSITAMRALLAVPAIGDYYRRAFSIERQQELRESRKSEP
jgi:hypothetical protein